MRIAQLTVLLIFSGWIFFSCSNGKTSESEKKIVILVGEKSHPATMHEYLKNAELIKVLLDESPDITGVRTELHFNGWPGDPATLDDADLILTISDGRDGSNGKVLPFMQPERMDIVKRQVDRGCGFMTFHYSTFAPDEYGEEILDWAGGYFDWQNDNGDREWYSAIKFMDVEVEIPDNGHPVLNGVEPFKVYEEYYYNMRFRENDPRLTPIITVAQLKSERKMGEVVSWAIERENGGRGFGTTLGHLYANWKNENYRKLLLNAIVWTAGIEVPENGIRSEFYDHRDVTSKLYNKSYRALILTGNYHPAHDWQANTLMIKKVLEKNGAVHADISVNINDLFQYDLRDYDFLAFNYANWEDPDALWQGSKESLIDYVNSGGSLMFIHFSNGAFHFSLQGAGPSDWPEYRRLCRRVWDSSQSSSHDKYGNFTVDIKDEAHEITRGIGSFRISDELYYNQVGDKPVQVLLSAVSVDTGREEPLAWTYELDNPTGKKARVFQTVLGHDTTSLSAPELQEILSRSAEWLARGTQRWNDL